MALVLLIGLAVLGVLLLIAGERNSDSNHPIWRALLLSLGGLFVASATLSLLWEMRGRRVFAEEVLAAAGVADDVRKAGLRAISSQYLEVADWPDLFRNATEIDLLASWGSTWRRRYEAQWNAWIERPNVRVRVLLPDPSDAILLQHLSRRFKKERQYVRSRIEETASFYQGLEARAGEGSTVAVRQIVRAPVWAYYRMGATVVVTLYPSSLASAPGVPAMVFAGEGETGRFFREQFEHTWTEANEET
jgi:hypothetical protein